ncbi:hypothetical protein [Agreia sp. Leaf283]|uniref:hypothetical protein n=1 Tax=Agreia sp. Leaf283 TaxID=1736321 RepID=UPI0006F9DAF8|nr:hypothetical protein [Agreia sp. Leaf283]KQP57382.1 hypothetical protein ASF51_05925 [Agreia sp. Leaf283]
MIANSEALVFSSFLAYVVGLAIGALVLYMVIRSAVASALYKHQLWLEQYRPATNPGPQPPAPPAPPAPPVP